MIAYTQASPDHDGELNIVFFFFAVEKKVLTEGPGTLGNAPYCGGRVRGVSLWLRGRLAFCR